VWLDLVICDQTLKSLGQYESANVSLFNQGLGSRIYAYRYDPKRRLDGRKSFSGSIKGAIECG
jgi:hypothetical protein